MEQAWLDSLSEDWVSQPRSSGSPVPSLPSPTDTTLNSSNAPPPTSRIPKYNPQKKIWMAGPGSTNSPLSERSLNENNVPLSLRLKQPSKLRDDISSSTEDRPVQHQRSMSDSTSHSSQYHTIQHRPDSASPDKKSKETPEWRRRILNRDLAYGEQCDLFSPAGLENIFRPPISPNLPPSKLQACANGASSIIMPSSPPPYASKRTDYAEKETIHDGQTSTIDKTSRKPQEVQYRLADEGPSNFSINDLSQGSSFQPQQSESSNGRGHDSTTAPSSLEPHTVTQAGPMNSAGRTFSGQSDVRNEELSPIYISRQNTVGGSMDFVADLPAPNLQQRLQDFREDTPVEDTVNDQSSQLVLDNITADTNDFAHNGKFVNLRRGGRSHEGSFQNHMLSPSSLPAIDESALLPQESTMLPEESMQASTPKKLPLIRKTRLMNENENETRHVDAALPPIPHTPHTSPGKSSNKEKDLSSGSPLKLFGTYDTFTNQKLLRRLSQFEEEGSDDEKPSIAPVQESTRSELFDGFVSASCPMKKTDPRKSQHTGSRKLSSFGEGDLDDFQFSEQISCDSHQIQQRHHDSDESSLPLQNQGRKAGFKFQLEPSPELESNSIISRRTKYSSTTNTTTQTISIRKTRTSSSPKAPPSQIIEDLETPRKRNGDSDGKRLPRSPFIDPTPKRRRTLQEADFEEASQGDLDIGLGSLWETHYSMQSVIGKKRKDARHDDDQQAANPKVLAMRQILRPRTPTPSQKLKRENNQSSGSRHSLAERARIQEDKIARIQAELDATETPPLPKALGASQHLLDGSRKGSVTTQDFLDEAKKIMGHIRDKAGARSGLTSVEESESENDRALSPGKIADGEPLEDSYEESTQEPFSRPPSREGPPLQRLPIKQVDPELLNHLRKYQEMSDIDGVIAFSTRSITLAKEANEALREVDRITAEVRSRLAGQEGTEETIESDPPNIRISENPDFHRKRKHSSSTASHNTGGLEADFPSHGSNSSSGQSTTHSIPTGSSRGSDSRRVIAPHTVSHLIPEQLAGMVFDRNRNIWIKRKPDSGESGRVNFLHSDETEDDPFGDIPDLSVDETQELQRIKLVAARLKQKVVAPGEQDLGRNQKSAQEKHTQSSEHVPEVLIPILEQSSILEDAESIYELPKARPAPKEIPFPKNITNVTNKGSKIEETFEKEISILEDRVGSATPVRRRHVTISFSSPLTSVIPPSPDRDTSSILNMEKDNDETIQSENESFMIAERKDKRSISMKSRSTTRKSSRRGSLGRHAFSTRPVSRIEERDEDATENNNGIRDRSISIVVTTPTVSMRTTSVVLATPRPAHEVGTLTLSPMSDFTIHQDDEPLGLNVSYVARNHRYSYGSESQRALSLTIKALVEKITEVEPYEPFWEHMKEIDLTDKKLTNLHKLDEFCSQLQEVDASNNRISQLDGLSRSVRNLRISHNCLTDLTAWGHLSNLQYIDVSNNELESLSAFKSLVHLRGIRADNNLITSISGVDQLDGLLSLRLRGNRVASVDLRGTRMQRLTELDLRNNQLSCLRNLSELSSLTDLDVEDNQLETFCTDIVKAHTSLKSLRLSGNNLEHINVGLYSNLRLLYLDRNRLGSVTGLYKTKHLDSLSLREQNDPTSLDLSFLSDAYEIRKLFLSGNLIHNFQPKFDFLNLQYLELANCGLETLQPNLGQMISNTRVLNLNYNALTDIAPLTGIVRLKKLYLAGNRLANIKRTATILSRLNGLTLVDLRANPMTQGFYPPVTESSLALNTVAGITETTEPYTMAKADTGKDVKYTRCLDMKTKMLRRVYEMMVIGGCRRLKMLDGLANDRSSIKAKDEIWDALIAGGFISLPGTKNQAENKRFRGANSQDARGEGSDEDDILPLQQPSAVLARVQEEELESTLKPAEKSIFEERWCAEDSFA